MNLFHLLSFLLRLSKEIRFSRLRITIIAGAGIISGVASTSMIALITQILTHQESQTGLLVGLFVTLCLMLPVFRFTSQVLLIDMMQKSLLAFRLRLARNILAAPLGRLEKVGPHRLVAALTNDINTIVDSMAKMPLLIMHVAVVASCLIYLGWLSSVVLLEIVGFIVLGVVTYQIPLIRALRRFIKARERYDDLAKDVRALTEGTKELKMHRLRRRAFLGRMEQSARALEHESRSGFVLLTAAASWGQVLFFGVLGLLVLLLPRLQSMDGRTLLGFTVILFQMMVPLEFVMNSLPSLGRALASVRRVEEMGLTFETEIKEREGEAKLARSTARGRLELVGVTHLYRREKDESFILGPIDLAFEPGELVFLVGGNGSGKTTLAKILLGLYAPESGEVHFAGQVIDDSNREEYREHFSAVFSDFFVFDSLLGLDAGSLDHEARRYLAKLHLQQKVQVKDGGLSTIDLSQGQRKRLALLTAYLEDRPIYLFDEWAADQDPIFKGVFYLELLPELKARGKTVFVISHDDHYFHVADRILKLDYGKVEADMEAEKFLDNRPAEVRFTG